MVDSWTSVSGGALKAPAEVSHLAAGLGKNLGDKIDVRAQELAEDFSEPAFIEYNALKKMV